MSHDMQIVSGSAGASRVEVETKRPRDEETKCARPLLARRPIHVRPATMDDLPFMDSLQKLHTKQVGWMPDGGVSHPPGLTQPLLYER